MYEIPNENNLSELQKKWREFQDRSQLFNKIKYPPLKQTESNYQQINKNNNYNYENYNYENDIDIQKNKPQKSNDEIFNKLIEELLHSTKSKEEINKNDANKLRKTEFKPVRIFNEQRYTHSNESYQNNKELLDSAVRRGDILEITTLLYKNKIAVDGYTLSLTKNPKILALLGRYANFDYQDLKKNKIDVVELLKDICAYGYKNKFVDLCKKAKINNEDAKRVLYQTCASGDEELFNFLLRNYNIRFTEGLVDNLLEKTISGKDFNINIFNNLANRLSPEKRRNLVKQYKIDKGYDQIYCNRSVINENGKLVVKDKVYNKNGKLVYYIIYNGNRKYITYYDKEGKKLTTARINRFGNLSFDNYLTEEQISNFKNQFSSRSYFDNELSFLDYASSSFREKNINVKVDFKEPKDISNIAIKSLDNDNIYCCNLVIDAHNVQILINKGNVVIINTGLNFDYIAKEIKKEAKKIGKNIKVNNVSLIKQATNSNSCNIASKELTETLIKNLKYKEDLKTYIEAQTLLKNIAKNEEKVINVNDDMNKRKKLEEKIKIDSEILKRKQQQSRRIAFQIGKVEDDINKKDKNAFSMTKTEEMKIWNELGNGSDLGGLFK